MEPKLRELQRQPLAGVRRHKNAREDARGDALLAMPAFMLLIDVNVAHALAVTFLQGTVAASKAAVVDGAAAAMGEHNKEDEYCRDIDGGAYEWEPVVMELGGRLGKGAMRVINRLAKIVSVFLLSDSQISRRSDLSYQALLAVTCNQLLARCCGA